MEKIIFVYPAKVYIAELPAKAELTSVTIAGATFTALKGRSWYDTKTSKVKIDNCEGIHILTKLDNGIFAPLAYYSDMESATGAITLHIANNSLVAVIQRVNTIISDIPAYEAQAAIDIAERQVKILAERAEAEEKRIALEKSRAANAEIVLQNKLADFKAGKAIDWDSFETLCARHNVKMHMRTIGAGRKGILSIARDNASTRGNTGCSGAFIAAKELFNQA